MTLPTRHSDAPFRDLESLFGSDLEFDIAELFAAANNLTDANFAPNANIVGDKFLDNSFASGLIQNNTVDGVKILDSTIVGGDLVNDDFDTFPLAAGAILNGAGASVVSGVALNNTIFTDIISAGITTGEAGSKVLIAFNMVYTQTGSEADITFRIFRDAVLLRTTPTTFHRFDDIAGEFDEAGAPITLYYLDTGHSASTTHNYKVDGKAANTTVDHSQAMILEFRK